MKQTGLSAPAFIIEVQPTFIDISVSISSHASPSECSTVGLNVSCQEIPLWMGIRTVPKLREKNYKAAYTSLVVAVNFHSSLANNQ